jgi:hypothetical protein
MDSKMECMRTLIEQDRQVDGHFTGYNVSLERTVLKKAKFLSAAAGVERPAAQTPADRTPADRTPGHRTPAQTAPAPPESPIAPPSGVKPVPKEASHPLFAAPSVQES